MATVEDCCAEHGIELRGEDLHPFHCGEHMTTHEMLGVWGCTCKVCDLMIINVNDPAGNGYMRRCAGIASALVPNDGGWRDDWWFKADAVPDDVLDKVGLTRNPPCLTP